MSYGLPRPHRRRWPSPGSRPESLFSKVTCTRPKCDWEVVARKKGPQQHHHHHLHHPSGRPSTRALVTRAPVPISQRPCSSLVEFVRAMGRCVSPKQRDSIHYALHYLPSALTQKRICQEFGLFHIGPKRVLRHADDQNARFTS